VALASLFGLVGAACTGKDAKVEQVPEPVPRFVYNVEELEKADEGLMRARRAVELGVEIDSAYEKGDIGRFEREIYMGIITQHAGVDVDFGNPEYLDFVGGGS